MKKTAYSGSVLSVLIAAIAIGQNLEYPSPPQDVILEIHSTDTDRFVLRLTGGIQLVDLRSGGTVVWEAESDIVKDRYERLLKGGVEFTHGTRVYVFGGKDLRRQLLAKAVGGF